MDNETPFERKATESEQIRSLSIGVAEGIGKEDELLDAVKVSFFVKENNLKSHTKIIEREKHLSILLTASNHMGSWIHDTVQ